MRLKKQMKIMTTSVVLLVLLWPAGAFAAYDYINISNPFLRKIPIAVPVFQAGKDEDGTADMAREAADLLAETLAFTRYFKPVNRDAFLEIPREIGVTRSDINYKNWRDIGADFLVTGSVDRQEDEVRFELRLFDVIQERMVIGKRYKGGLDDQRKMVRRFCGEIMKSLTGSRGFFESSLAFISTGPGNKEVYTCEFDGYNPRRRTFNQAIDLSPAWSWDGRWLAYTSYQKGKPDLYIRHIDEDRGAVVARKGVNISPAWMPGSFALAATLSFNGDQEIYLLTGSGKITRRLTRSWGIDVSPTFSPDARKMAFVSNRAGSPQIYVKDIASGKIQRLTFEGRYNTTPEWSPTGNRVAFSALEDNQFNIKVVDVETREVIQLTRDQGDNESPTWSPDGSLIAFCTTREGGVPKIYVMTAFGTDQKRLLDLPGGQTSPAWSR
ncbi:MAG: Tol-Pal system beta propeller repeat protein TolB [Desulfosudaceae bacterium]